MPRGKEFGVVLLVSVYAGLAGGCLPPAPPEAPRAGIVCYGNVAACKAAQGGAPVRTADPVFSLSGQTQDGRLQLTIHCATEGATIHYTIDGSDPTLDSPVFDGQPIELNLDSASTDNGSAAARSSKEVLAIATYPDLEPSNIVLAPYAGDRVQAAFNVAYDDPPAVGGDKHRLDIYQPIGQNGNKVLIFVHGGAWKSGDKNEYFWVGNLFAGSYGYTTVLVNYELCGDPWRAMHPGHINDVTKAVAWVYRNISQYGGDPQQICLLGWSAGGHLVSLLATDTRYIAAEGLTTDILKGVISMSGAYDLAALTAWPNPYALEQNDVAVSWFMFLETFGSYEEEALSQVSPYTYVRPDEPPFLLMHAWKDVGGFNGEALRFYARIRSVSAPVEIFLLKQSDVPQEMIDRGYDGHWAEVSLLSPQYWDSVPARRIVEFVESH